MILRRGMFADIALFAGLAATAAACAYRENTLAVAERVGAEAYELLRQAAALLAGLLV